ncbi:MAG: hypothetical protein ABIV06_11250, partial [Thermoanaerobaculia bacterium]
MREIRSCPRALIAPLLLLLPGALGAQPAAAPSPPASVAQPTARGVLPPIACVSAVRDARIARGRGDAPGAAAARQTLEAAVDL